MRNKYSVYDVYATVKQYYPHGTNNKTINQNSVDWVQLMASIPIPWSRCCSATTSLNSKLV